jgi:hypothetical protein
MRSLLVAAVLAFIPAVAQAQQTTPSLRDIVELTKAGVGDEVLLALIEVHRPVYPVDPDTLKGLKAAGVSSQVMIAMVKSGREQQPATQPAPLDAQAPVDHAAPATAPPPQVVVIDHERENPRAREVAVPIAVPIQYPVYTRFVYPVRNDIPRTETPPRPKSEPVYWGWGGKLRPDAWKPAEEPKGKR